MLHKKTYLCELKIWRREKYKENGRDQLSNYLTTRGMDEGNLVMFDFSKRKKVSANCETQLDSIEPQWIEWNGKRVLEVIV